MMVVTTNQSFSVCSSFNIIIAEKAKARVGSKSRRMMAIRVGSKSRHIMAIAFLIILMGASELGRVG